MEDADIIVFGDKAVDITIVNELNSIGVKAVHYRDTVLQNIQRGANDPEIIAYASITNCVILTRDVSSPAFEYVTSSDINGRQVQEDFSNNRVLIRNRYFRDCVLELDEIKKNTKYKVKSGLNGHNGILKYDPNDISNQNDIQNLCKKVAKKLQNPNIHSTIKTIRV